LTRTEIRELLQELELQPSRKLGQNFLCDPNAAGWIARQIEPEPDDVVIEPGAGLGSVSSHLIGRVRKLVLLEKDHRLAEWLRTRAEGRTDVEVIEGDACEYDFRPLFAEGPVKIVGNLPYSAGTAILTHFLAHPTPVVRAVFMLQKEMSKRLSAVPRTKAYGSLTLRIQQRWKVEFLRTFGPDLFLPVPEVDSSVIGITPRLSEQLPVFDRGLYSQLVKQGFSQRRKQLRKLLPKAEFDWEELLTGLGHTAAARAEELSMEDWVALARAFAGHADAPDEGQKSSELFDVVDENDEVTKQATRGEVHAEGLRHRAVHILLFNKGGEIFLQRRSHLKDTHPLKWDSSAAGHVDSGETYEDCAPRELAEELGIKEAALTRVAGLKACSETDEEFIAIFEAQDWKGKVRTDPREIDTGGWFSLETVSRWIVNRPEDFATGFRTVWKEWLASQSE